MTIKEAILLSLEDFPNGALAKDVYQNILNKKIMSFSEDAKTPLNTVHALMGTMVKKGDSRIKRFKNVDKQFCYYLSKYAKKNEGTSNVGEVSKRGKAAKDMAKTFHERDLHPLFCLYLSSQNILPKTIYHERSSKAEEHQKWLHPDIIGAQFIEYGSKICNSFFNATNKKESLSLFSYELKREIANDYELKRCFFQAVSNSSWANYGYLVVFDINENLREEIERLNNSFGIGFILLKANPYESQIWYPAKYKPLDFRTIDRLCINKDFAQFIQYIEKVVTAGEKYIDAQKKELQAYCDKIPFNDTDKEIREYCLKHNIPWSDDSDNYEE